MNLFEFREPFFNVPFVEICVSSKVFQFCLKHSSINLTVSTTDQICFNLICQCLHTSSLLLPNKQRKRAVIILLSTQSIKLSLNVLIVPYQ